MNKYCVSGIIFILMLSLVVGCTPAKKLNPSRPFMPTEPDRITKPARNVTELNNLNNRLSIAVSKVGNVNRATVVVLDTTAFIGLDIKPGLSDEKQYQIKKKAANKVQTVERRIVSTWVTTKPEALTTIDQARTDIKAGKPSSEYSRKLRLILDNSEHIK